MCGEQQTCKCIASHLSPKLILFLYIYSFFVLSVIYPSLFAKTGKWEEEEEGQINRVEPRDCGSKKKRNIKE
jgi:hypothetical protein